MSHNPPRNTTSGYIQSIGPVLPLTAEQQEACLRKQEQDALEYGAKMRAWADELAKHPEALQQKLLAVKWQLDSLCQSEIVMNRSQHQTLDRVIASIQALLPNIR